VSEGVITRGIKDKNRGAADHGGYITIMDCRHIFTGAANAALTEADAGAGLNYAVNVKPLLLRSWGRFNLRGNRTGAPVHDRRHRFTF
jgi:hypothetical protein